MSPRSARVSRTGCGAGFSRLTAALVVGWSCAVCAEDTSKSAANRAAWAFYEEFDKPFLTAFSDSDPVTRGQEQRFIDSVPGAITPSSKAAATSCRTMSGRSGQRR